MCVCVSEEGGREGGGGGRGADTELKTKNPHTSNVGKKDCWKRLHSHALAESPEKLSVVLVEAFLRRSRHGTTRFEMIRKCAVLKCF